MFLSVRHTKKKTRKDETRLIEEIIKSTQRPHWHQT